MENNNNDHGMGVVKTIRIIKRLPIHRSYYPSNIPLI